MNPVLSAAASELPVGFQATPSMQLPLQHYQNYYYYIIINYNCCLHRKTNETTGRKSGEGAEHTCLLWTGLTPILLSLCPK